LVLQLGCAPVGGLRIMDSYWQQAVESQRNPVNQFFRDKVS
jgi:hypothetical protein